MKVAILDARQGAGRVADKSYTVAYRNLVVLRDYFQADLFVNSSDIKNEDDYDIIICGFGSTSCEKDKSTEFLQRNKKARLFWLVGEYEQSTFAPLFYSKREFQVIKNFEHKIKNKLCIGQHFININALLAGEQRRDVPKKHGCIYYGRWRPDRLCYFRQYLDSGLVLSTHSKNIKMFHHNGCNPRLIKPLVWRRGRETLNLFKSSLYIEDVFTHSHYNCLGNRFYEAIMCNCVPFFDESCRNTVERAGLEGADWHFVGSSSDIARKNNQINGKVKNRVKGWAVHALTEKQAVLAALEDLFNG